MVERIFIEKYLYSSKTEQKKIKEMNGKNVMIMNRIFMEKSFIIFKHRMFDKDRIQTRELT